MDIQVAKDLLHIERWLTLAAAIARDGYDNYVSDELVQEAGDSLMIKVGEAAKNLASRGLQPPAGISWSDAARNREILAHHYSTIDRRLTWGTLSVSLPELRQALAPLFERARNALRADSSSGAPEQESPE